MHDLPHQYLATNVLAAKEGALDQLCDAHNAVWHQDKNVHLVLDLFPYPQITFFRVSNRTMLPFHQRIAAANIQSLRLVFLY